MKVGDRIGGKMEGNKFPRCGHISSISHNDCDTTLYITDFGWAYFRAELKPLINRSWLTTQADIDCQGRY